MNSLDCAQMTVAKEKVLATKLKTFWRARFAIWCIPVVLIGSCATTPVHNVIVPATILPDEVAINRAVDYGGLLTVMLRSENGQGFRFILDTGAPGTLLPKSFEPMLGKRLGKGKIATLDGQRENIRIYAAPRLYLGNIPLVTGDRMGVWDDSIGVLGLDCLKHYCIQLDFAAGKLRFLDPEHLNGAELGKDFQLKVGRYASIDNVGLLDGNGVMPMVDTGFPYDMQVKPAIFGRLLAEHRASSLLVAERGVISGVDPGLAFVPECRFAGETYTNLMVGKGVNLIGLGFLARHQVTFNFPKGNHVSKVE